MAGDASDRATGRTFSDAANRILARFGHYRKRIDFPSR